jgi:large subunit ribosomal protein L21
MLNIGSHHGEASSATGRQAGCRSGFLVRPFRLELEWTMYALVRIKGLQYRVEPETHLRVPALGSEVGDIVDLDEVLLVSKGGEIQVGSPTVAGCSVTAEVVQNGRARKVVVFKKRRRKNYRRKKGHRQHFTEILIKEIKTA